ncbi:MAG: response regulator transcription factor [Rhizobiaceae bacterium]|nr:response regulator transcription factor [Rhizobiaceae bacterium]
MRVLLVEDTEDVASAIVSSFARHGHAVDHASTCATATGFLAVQPYDLLIIDVNLPDGSGIDILRSIRCEKLATPVLMLTARIDIEDRIGALDLGADDYLTKPFDLRELEARARALIRRRADETAGTIEFGDLSFDAAGRALRISGVPVTLARREFSLLEVLLLNRGRVMPKERLFEKLFGFSDEDVGMNAIELYVARLRRKIEGSRVSIRTLRGVGYQIALDEE